MAEISPKPVYRGKGFILKSVSNEYLESNKNNVDNVKKRKKYIYVDKKKNIFKRYNPVVIPILNRNIKNYTREKTKKNEKNKIRDINIFEESELNSFLLRNRAFRLTWIKIIKLIKKEIDIQISKNLSDVFEDIYLYSMSSSEYLPLILMTAGTNVTDHEIVIDALSYKLKRWIHKKGRRGKKRIPKSYASKGLVKKIRSDNYLDSCNTIYDDFNKSNCLSSKWGKEGNNLKKRKKNNNENDDNGLVSDSSYIIDENHDSSYYEHTDSEGNSNCGDCADCDVYVCSLNSSTSNNVNSAICNIYNQLYKEYKIRKYLSKNVSKKNGKYRHKCNNNINRFEEENKINGDSFYEQNEEPSSNPYSNYDESEMDNDYVMNSKLVSIDKLVELYNNMTEMNRKCDNKIRRKDFGKNCGNNFERNESDLSWLNGETKESDNELFLKKYNNFELYNIENYYFNDGRKKVRVIVLIHDCEYFNINIFNGILNILINLRINNKICLSVILGVSSTFFFNNVTTPSTQSKLRIKNVDILNNKLVCENICNNILFKNILPFVINFRTIHTIKLLLYKNNQSISHLIHMLYILTKDFYDNNLFSFLSLPISYYFNNSDSNEFESDSEAESVTEYSPYTFVRTKNKTFNTFIQYNVRILHKKIISLCYSSNLYYFHLSYLKKKYSSILIKNYYLIHDEDSDVHTPTISSINSDEFTLKKNKKIDYEQNEDDQFDVVDNCTTPTKVNNVDKNEKEKNGVFDRKLYAWKFKANTINWWLDHPFRDLVYCYENGNSVKKEKKTVFNIEDKLLLEPGEDNELKNLKNPEHIKEINKYLCENFIPETVLKLLERKYAFNIAINFINIIIKRKPEYNNSLKRIEYFRKLFDNFEKAKWNNNTNILYIEELYKIAENDVKKCINFLIDIVNPYYFKNQEILLDILKEFKKYYIKIYSLVYNLEDYLYLLKEKMYEKDKEYLINDDFSKNFSYSDSFSIYYSLLYKLDDLIEMFRKFLKQKDSEVNVFKGETFQTNYHDSTNMSDEQSENNEGDEKKAYKRYLTIHNTTLKVNKMESSNDRIITVEDISDSLNIFIHDYLYLLLLPPLHYNPLAFDIAIHKPDRDFTDIMTRNIKGELLQTLCYNNPYKTGNLMCSCCFCKENPTNENMDNNITCDNKIYLNPYYDNISTLEDLVNLYRIYERCNKTIDLYNLFILFVNIKVEKFENTIEGNNDNEQMSKISKTGQNGFLDIGILQEYYLKFVIVVTTFCYIFKVLKQPNVSALLNYTEKDDYLSNNYDEDMTENEENEQDAEEQIKKFLIDIKKSLQGCTSKKLLFGKMYYNNTIMSRELCLQKMMEYNYEYKRETMCVNDNFKRQKN